MTMPTAVDELVNGLSPEAKRAVLLRLLSDGVGTTALAPTALKAPNGEVYAYHVPVADWRTRKVVAPELSREEIERIRCVDETPNNTFDAIERIEQLSREDRG